MPTRKGTHGPAPTVADIAVQRDQDLRILELARRGRNGRQIADELGVHHTTVYRTLERIWSRTEQPKAVELRAKWDARLEAGVDAIWDAYTAGEIPAVNAMIRLAERAAKLHGLDQQISRDAGALADALLGDPDARRERAQQIRDELAAARARREADTASG